MTPELLAEHDRIMAKVKKTIESVTKSYAQKRRRERERRALIDELAKPWEKGLRSLARND